VFPGGAGNVGWGHAQPAGRPTTNRSAASVAPGGPPPDAVPENWWSCPARFLSAFPTDQFRSVDRHQRTGNWPASRDDRAGPWPGTTGPVR